MYYNIKRKIELIFWRGQGESNPFWGLEVPDPVLEAGVLPLHYVRLPLAFMLCEGAFLPFGVEYAFPR